MPGEAIRGKSPLTFITMGTIMDTGIDHSGGTEPDGDTPITGMDMVLMLV